MKLHLRVIEGPHAGAQFMLERHDVFIVGRDPQAHLSLKLDAESSRHHFMLEFSPPNCYLRDLGSRNGTKVNGKPVKEVMLSDGDVVCCGQTSLQVALNAQTPRSGLCPSCAKQLQLETTWQPNGEATQAYVCPGCREQLSAMPQSVPGYEIMRPLGRGGMGVVYMARHSASGKVVAVKTMLPECAMAASAVQLFLREASVLSQLDHRRIVRFLEVGAFRGQFFLAMEYVPTIDLLLRLRQCSRPRRIRLSCAITCQILEGLRYAHARGFVHRDVKPSNVLLTRGAKRLRSKLADFGLAKNFENGGFSGVTRRGDIRGSLPYSPPEQIIDCRYSQPSGDIYSTGATLYRLLTDQLPHHYTESADPYSVVLGQNIVPLRERCADIPAELAAVVEKALARDPAQRFASASDMYQQLLPYAKDVASSEPL